MKPKIGWIALLIILCTGLLLAQGHGRRGGGMHMGGGLDPLLTPEQRTELHELMSTMREDGATREELHEAITALLTSWSIDPTQFGHRGYGQCADMLTAEQCAELQAMVGDMRKSGATREEIHTAVTQLFTSWGIEKPGHGFRHMGRGQRALMEQLTDDQRAELHELMSSMRDDGATRREIHAAVTALLSEWGIESDFSGRRANIQARNYPNPFNPETQITYTLAEPAVVRVNIYNITGHLVRSYQAVSRQVGSYSVYWNGRTGTGTPVPSGVYFYRIQAGDEVLTDRMLLMK
ncbi:MAG: FlgD immunoglobulin-like domain containing protein [Candidatus Neomarinimicrobiota bacterium]